MEFNPVLFVGGFMLFVVAAVGMLLAPLLIGWLLRPHSGGEEKAAIYECGEPTIGPSNVQFDLRFYVVALLFIVFDVEVAFFFPWAVVFGKANTLASSNLTAVQREHVSAALTGDVNHLAEPVTAEAARLFLRIAFFDLLVFFGIVLVGFAYLWKRGDLDWVRAVAKERALEAPPRPPTGDRFASSQPTLTA